VRMRVWPPSDAVEVVLATRGNPAQYLVHRVALLVTLLGHGYPYVKVVNGRGSRLFEWYRLPHEGGVGTPKRLTLCSPIIVSPSISTPPCPAK